MRILILGGDGMLGHQLFKSLRPRHDVRVTLRHDIKDYASYGLFDHGNSYGGIDLKSFLKLYRIMTDFRPQALINAVGIVKKHPLAEESIPSININALMPHCLADLCRVCDSRLVHFSTDCVFSGEKGNYREDDPSDAKDLYGRTKFLGEVHEDNSLTLRTSVIGKELSRKNGLFEWFLAQEGPVKGYRKALDSGFTCMEMARIVEKMLVEHPLAHGLYQVSSDPINNCELLQLMREKLGKSIEIIPDDSFACDRSLDSERFRREFGYFPPTWETMIEELVREHERLIHDGLDFDEYALDQPRAWNI
jgi:dTDP-4-dehydrorhamnose reductase